MKKLLLLLLLTCGIASAQTVTVNELDRSGNNSFHAFNPTTTPEYRLTVTFVSSHTLVLDNSILTSTNFSEEYNVLSGSLSAFQARFNEAREGDGLFGTIHGDRRSILFLNGTPDRYIPFAEANWDLPVVGVLGIQPVSPDGAYSATFFRNEWTIRYDTSTLPDNFIGTITGDANAVIAWYNCLPANPTLDQLRSCL